MPINKASYEYESPFIGPYILFQMWTNIIVPLRVYEFTKMVNICRKKPYIEEEEVWRCHWNSRINNHAYTYTYIYIYIYMHKNYAQGRNIFHDAIFSLSCIYHTIVLRQGRFLCTIAGGFSTAVVFYTLLVTKSRTY